MPLTPAEREAALDIAEMDSRREDDQRFHTITSIVLEDWCEHMTPRQLPSLDILGGQRMRGLKLDRGVRACFLWREVGKA